MNNNKKCHHFLCFQRNIKSSINLCEACNKLKVSTMALLRAKFVQITKDIVNIRAITDPIEDEDDNETVHGFVENRTVFGASGELFQFDHWPSIQKYLRQSYISKSHCDVSIIVSDGTVEVNRS